MAVKAEELGNSASLIPTQAVAASHHHEVSDLQFILRFLKHTVKHAPRLYNERGVPKELWGLVNSDLYKTGAGVPHGNAEPVLTVPGATAGDWSLTLLNRYLKTIGYTPYSSGIFCNIFPGEKYIPILSDDIKRITDKTQMQVTIVGHSLGASLAKVISDKHPEEVKRVVGFAGVLNSSVGVNPALFVLLFPAAVVDLVVFGPSVLPKEIAIFHKLDEPVKVPHYSLYTMDDGIITPLSCIRRDSYNIKVKSTHTGMVGNENAFRELAHVLRRDDPIKPRLEVVRHRVAA
jgi:pimeloyl-ACP methyl ester carboxylesterase